MFSFIYKIKPPPNRLRSSLKTLKPKIWNWLIGNVLSSFDSEIRNKSKALTMLSAKINLFLIELIFKWPTMMLLALSTLCCWISRRSLLAIGVEQIFALKERELYATRLWLFWSQILSKFFKKSLKFLIKRGTPSSFKGNLLLLRCLLGLMFPCNIMPLLFALHSSSKIILTSSAFFYFHHRVELY